MSTPTRTTSTSTPTPEFLDRFISSIASAFHDTPLTRAFICEIDSNTSSSPISHARLTRHFGHGIRASVSHPPASSHHNAILAEAGDWAALASWEPPTYTGPPFSEAKSDPGPLLSEWRVAVARMRAQYIGYATDNDDDNAEGKTERTATAVNGVDKRQTQPRKLLRPHYHLSFLARVPGREAVKGAISAVMLPFLAKAGEEGMPVWLEATSPRGVGVYEHYGFRVCEEVTIGVGRVDADGWPKEGGEGIKAWGMLWDRKNVGDENRAA